MTKTQTSINRMAFIGVSPIEMINPVYKAVPVNASINGNSDIYTCPSGKKAAVLHMMIHNPTGGAITYFPQIYISGTYYKVKASVSGAAGVTTSFSGFTFVLEAGMKIAMNATATGLNTWMRIVEFDAATNVKTAYLTTLANGNNTLYTCPAATTAIILGSSLSAFDSAGSIYYYNSSGGSRNIGVNVVPSGGSVSAANQMMTAQAVSSDSPFNTSVFNAILAAGDFINFVTNAATATQIAWVNMAEMPV